MVYTKDLKSFAARLEGSTPSSPTIKTPVSVSRSDMLAGFFIMEEVESKGAGTTVPSRGREICQQANICDRLPPRPPNVSDGLQRPIFVCNDNVF